MFFIFLIACTRKFAKQSYSHQIKKERTFMFFIFLIACTRKTMQWDYLREVIKEKWSLISFSLLEEGEVDDGAD